MLAQRSARVLTGVSQMYRVTLVALVGALVAGCSMGSTTMTAGFSDSESPSYSNKSLSTGLGGNPRTSRERVAALDDQAPRGTYEKAPRGALSDRDYSSTKLSPAAAQKLINAYRKQKGLRPLALNAELTAAAKSHSRDLAKWDRISHYGSDGSTPWDRVKRSGYKARLAAENVGTGQASFKEVLRGWKESEGHNKNLLIRDAEHMGIALVYDGRTEFKSFWTLVLGSKM